MLIDQTELPNGSVAACAPEIMAGMANASAITRDAALNHPFLETANSTPPESAGSMSPERQRQGVAQLPRARRSLFLPAEF